MKPAPIPKDEGERLASLHTLGLLDSPPEERFDRITRIATKIFKVPISTLTLVDAKREWFKSCQGLSQHEGDRAISFCGYALLSANVLVVPDTKKDDRFADNPMVIGEPYLRFYAGAAITSADGQRIGVFCIKDTKPRKFLKDDIEILKELAAWAESEINSHNLGLNLEEQKQLQETLVLRNKELEESKAKDEAILASIGDGVITVDTNGIILFINSAAEKLIHVKASEAIGKFYHDYWWIEDESGKKISDSLRPIEIVLKTKKVLNENSYIYVNKDTRISVSITIAPIILNGELLGIVDVFRDITHERDVDKSKTEFVSLASHQLRTPLTSINWYIEMLQSGDAGVLNDKQRKFLSEVYKGSKRMVQLVNDLLNASRLETGRLKIEPVPTDLIAFIGEVRKEVEALVQINRCQVSLELPESVEMVNVDRILLREVITNLLTNAIYYSSAEKKGIVTVSLVVNPQAFIIEVKDNGIGIPNNVQERIFDKFFRADNARAAIFNGNGLGLYLSKKIMESSGGTIGFSSQPNQETRFYISIPASGMKSKIGEKELDTKKILIPEMSS